MDGGANTLSTLLPVLGAVGMPGLLVLVTILILTGRLIPKSLHEERMADKDIVIEKVAKLAEVIQENNKLLLQQGQTTLAMTQATSEVLGVKPNA